MQFFKPTKNRDADVRDNRLGISLMDLTQILMQGFHPSEKWVGTLLDRIEGTP